MSIYLRDVITAKSVQIVMKRLYRHGINIQSYCREFSDEPFGSNPYGFNFFCLHGPTLVNVLKQNRGFGKANAVFDLKWNCDVFREVSGPDSLHIIINRNPAKRSVIHLDSISIVEGRDSAGQIIYAEDLALQMRHLRVDLLHKAN